MQAGSASDGAMIRDPRSPTWILKQKTMKIKMLRMRMRRTKRIQTPEQEKLNDDHQKQIFRLPGTYSD
jgi:hypothetical protein